MTRRWLKEVFYRLLDSAIVHNRNEVKVAVMCIITAIIFWFLYALNRDYSAKITYPIQFQYDSTRYTLKNEPKKEVSLLVYGHGWNILNNAIHFKTKPIPLFISGKKFIPPNQILPAASKSISDLKIQSVTSDTIFLELKNNSEKR